MKRLFGGHRNRVYKTNGFVKVIWKDGFKRRDKIREGVLLENFVAAHTAIRSRLLVDKSKSIQEENGKLVTYFHYCEGEIRYPWNPAEIASAAKLLGKLHKTINSGKDSPSRTRRTVLNRKIRLHLDFARGNILFQKGTSAAAAVIDFETTAPGPIEQELGRTLSFILVDTPAPSSLASRMDALLTNYPFPYKKNDVVEWAIKYLQTEDYGGLNHMRNEALRWLT